MSSYISSLLRGWGSSTPIQEELAGEGPGGGAGVDENEQSPMYQGEAGGAVTTSVSWLSVENDDKNVRVVIKPSAANVFVGVGETTALNLISIVGAARQGKSFLMNLLAGEQNIFKISNKKDPCTQGIDISKKIMHWAAFHRMDQVGLKNDQAKKGGGLGVKASSEPLPKIGFVDVEGQGDRDVAYDANLISPIMLTSKVILFNWKDSLQRDRLLNLLAIMQRAAYNVATEEEEDDGDGGCRGSGHKIFGHLHIIFRDWHYEGTVTDVHKTLFNHERSTAPDAAARNTLRNVLQDSFASITIWLLPPPVEKTAALCKELREGDLSDEFIAQVNKLRHALAEQLRQPHHFHGKILTGPKIAALVPQIVNTLNSGKQIMPRSAYASLVESEITRVQAAYLVKFQQALEKVKKNAEATPISSTALESQLLAQVHKLIRDFDRWLRTLGDEALQSQAATAFSEHCTKGVQEVNEFNQSHFLATHLMRATKKAKEVFNEKFTNVIEGKMPCAPERLIIEGQKAKEAAEAVIKKVVMGEPQVDELLKDSLDQLYTHAELMISRMEKINYEKLSKVHRQEIQAYHQAKNAFQSAFFDKLATLKAKGPTSEADFLKALDDALKSSRQGLKQNLSHGVTTSERKEELDNFLVAIATTMKAEQGCLYQLRCVQEYYAKSLTAVQSLFNKGIHGLSHELPVKSEAQLQQNYNLVKDLLAADLLQSLIPLVAAGDDCKAVCDEAWSAFAKECFGVLKRENERCHLLKEVQQLKTSLSEKEGQLTSLSEKEKAAAASKSNDKVALAEKDKEIHALQKRIAELEQEKKKEAAAAAAAEAAQAKKRKAEEMDAAKQPPLHKSRVDQGVEQMEVDENDGSQEIVDDDEQAEEDEVEVEQPKTSKSKPKTKPAAARRVSSKGGGGVPVGVSSPVGSPGAKLAQAREDERKRIEDETKKRITRTNRK